MMNTNSSNEFDNFLTEEIVKKFNSMTNKEKVDWMDDDSFPSGGNMDLLMKLEFPVFVKLEEDCVCFFNVKRNSWWYRVDISEIKDVNDVTKWVYHMSEKQLWIRTEHIHKFLDICKNLVPELKLW